jgi:hypothetical protein
MQDGSRGGPCQDEPDYRAANREKHLSDEPAAPRQLRPISSRIGAPATKCIGGATPERSWTNTPEMLEKIETMKVKAMRKKKNLEALREFHAQ